MVLLLGHPPDGLILRSLALHCGCLFAGGRLHVGVLHTAQYQDWSTSRGTRIGV